MDKKNSLSASKLADMVEAHGLMKAPANLKASILERSRQMDVQFIVTSNRLSKKLELFTYELKVSAAVACCVGFILAAPQTKQEKAFLRPPSDYTPFHVEASERFQTWTEKFYEFSNQIWDREGFLHDK